MFLHRFLCSGSSGQTLHVRPSAQRFLPGAPKVQRPNVCPLLIFTFCRDLVAGVHAGQGSSLQEIPLYGHVVQNPASGEIDLQYMVFFPYRGGDSAIVLLPFGSDTGSCSTRIALLSVRGSASRRLVWCFAVRNHLIPSAGSTLRFG
jgi:hypothetical protein